MYAITFKLYRPEWLNTAIYAHLAELYQLPSIQALLVSLERDIEWTCEPETQVYYLDNLREAAKRHVFQIRFHTSPKTRDFTDLFLSLNDDQQVHLLSIQFQTRGDRGCSSRIIGWLKDIIRKPDVDLDELQFELEGYGEREGLRYIREHSISAFQWQESLGRYLHVTDDFRSVKEIKKFRS